MRHGLTRRIQQCWWKTSIVRFRETWRFAFRSLHYFHNYHQKHTIICTLSLSLSLLYTLSCVMCVMCFWSHTQQTPGLKSFHPWPPPYINFLNLILSLLTSSFAAVITTTADRARRPTKTTTVNMGRNNLLWLLNYMFVFLMTTGSSYMLIVLWT